MAKEKRTRASFMSGTDKAAMGSLPRTHVNCMERTGKFRPGKTAKDRYLKFK